MAVNLVYLASSEQVAGQWSSWPHLTQVPVLQTQVTRVTERSLLLATRLQRRHPRTLGSEASLEVSISARVSLNRLGPASQWWATISRMVGHPG